MLLELGVDEPLQRAGSERRLLAHDRLRYQAPTERFGQLIGGDLPPEEPVRKVPQRSLAPVRLVNGVHLVAVVAEGDEERGVRAPGHAALDLDVAVAQDGQG